MVKIILNIFFEYNLDLQCLSQGCPSIFNRELVRVRLKEPFSSFCINQMSGLYISAHELLYRETGVPGFDIGKS